MNQDRNAAVIVNDLDSMMHRIESLPAHPRYTDALVAVQSAIFVAPGNCHRVTERKY